jgi:hypothetical protein
MKYSFAALALAATGALAGWDNGTVAYTTEIVTALTTYCPASTQITQGGKTYTVSSATTLVRQDLPIKCEFLAKILIRWTDHH